jgi:hypothetical protein
LPLLLQQELLTLLRRPPLRSQLGIDIHAAALQRRHGGSMWIVCGSLRSASKHRLKKEGKRRKVVKKVI